MNKWCGIGRLTKDPTVRYIGETETAVASFSIAIDDGYGEKKKTNFIPIKVFGKQAENCEKYLTKGRKVGVEGKIQTGSYKNKDGQTVYTMDVVADRVEFLEFGDKSDGNDIPSGFRAIDDGEIPFG